MVRHENALGVLHARRGRLIVSQLSAALLRRGGKRAVVRVGRILSTQLWAEKERGGRDETSKD
ncbi:uncharacterized protein V6R79_000682 [Siganus canaliculatus]